MKFKEKWQMIKYKNIIICGANSSIASFVIPKLNFNQKNVIATTTNSEIPQYMTNTGIKKIITRYDDQNELFLKLLDQNADIDKFPTLVLNFTGFYGDISPISKIKVDSVFNTIENNLKPFLIMSQVLTKLPSGSLMISFSGAGIGGDSLDDSSIGYVASKSLISLLTEVINLQISKQKNFMVAISPGPFPSRMQTRVAESLENFIPLGRKVSSENVKLDTNRLERLVAIINWISNNPKLASGRLWSAVHDTFPVTEINDSFGKIRRIY